MIVVEGPDGAGKTTLITELSQATGIQVASRVVSKDAQAMVDLREWTEENVARGFHPAIYDRHRLISEPIYGPVLRDELEPGFDNLVWLGLMMWQFYKANPIVIYCIPPLQTVLDNTRDDPDNKVVADPRIMQMIWGAYYNKAITEYAIRTNAWIFDYTQDTRTTAFVKTQVVKAINLRLKDGK